MWQLAPILRTLLRHKLGVFLLVTQIACSITIFSNMAFIAQQIIHSINQPAGFDQHRLFSISVRLLNARISYAEAQRDLAGLQALAGVEQVALSRWVPLAGLSYHEFFRTAVAKDTVGQSASTAEVSPQILTTLGLRLLAGRHFTQEDMVIKAGIVQPQVQNIIITRLLADELFGAGQDVVGKRIYQDDLVREIIGVADNWLGFSMLPNGAAEKTVFYPGYNEADVEHRYLIRVKSPKDMMLVSDAVTQLISRHYKNELLSWIDTVDDARMRANSQNWVILHLFLVLMVILGFVIAFAICGQTLFWITQRTKQIGIRRALGASRRGIIIYVLIENTIICALGLLIGIVLSLAVNETAMQSAGTLPMSPLFLLYSCAILLGLCLASAAVPAWRASKISPSLASRSL